MADPLAVQVTFSGYNRVNNQLRAAASFYADESDAIIEKHVKSEASRLRSKPYPPMLPGQKYRRTFRLGTHFRAQHQGKNKWAVINRVKSLRYGRPYAVWVVKKGMQNRRVHLRRWWTIDDELAKNAPVLTKNLSVELEQLLNRQRD